MKKMMTLFLTALVVSSVVLTFRLWFAEKLWPEGYNFFSVWSSVQPFEKKEYSAPRHEELFMPDRMVVNCVGSRRSIYTESNQEFSSVYEIAKKNISRWLKAGQAEFEKIEEEQYYQTLKTRSLLLQYPVEMPVRILGQLMEIGASENYETVSSVTELVLVPKEGDVQLLLMDQKKKEAYCYHLGTDGGELMEAINRYGTGNANTMLSAFELGFYRQPEDSELMPKLILNPFVMLDTSNQSQTTEVLEANIPIGNPDDMEQIDDLLRLFGYNPNTIRRYTEATDARVFVSDRSTLRLYPDGLLEYNATEARYGIPLLDMDGTGDAQGYLESIDRTADWLFQLFRTLGMEEMPKMRVTSDILEQHYKDFSFSMDYQVNGRTVAINYEGTELVNSLHHGAVLEIQDNRIISMRVLLRDYAVTEETMNNMPLLSALDVFSAKTEESYEAEDVSLCFIDTGRETNVKACWSIVLSNGEAVAISEEEQ